MTRQPILDDALLRPFDAAPSSVVNETTRIRSKARLEQILATSPARVPANQVPPHRVPSVVRRRVRRLRWAGIPVAALLVVGAGVLLPGGPSTTPAFAGWSASAEPLIGTDLDAADSACRTAIASGRPRFAVGDGPVVAERRGDWAFLTFVRDGGLDALGPGGSGFSCLTELGGATSPLTIVGGTGIQVVSGPSDLHEAIIGARTASNWVRSTLDSDQVSVGSVGQYRLTRGSFSLVAGTVGLDVESMTVHTDVGLSVHATIADGRFAAWWPDTRLAENLVTASDGHLVDLGGATRFSVTLRDGTVLDPAPLITGQPPLAGNP